MTNLLKSECRTQNAEQSNSVVKITSFVLMITLSMIFKNASPQTLSFTTNVTSVSPGTVVTITNTSTSIPANSLFKWEFTNAKIILDSTPMVSYSTLFSNKMTLTFRLTNFTNINNGSNFTIKLSATDPSKNLLVVAPFQQNLLMANGVAPILPGTCHDPVNLCANKNLICNGNFEWKSSCPYEPGQLYLAEPWQSSSFNDFNTTDYFNNCSIIPTAFGTTKNGPGGQPTLTGTNPNEGYSGFLAYFNANYNQKPPSREYLKQEMKSIMVPGQTYTVECDISLSDLYGYYKLDKNLGVIFTTSDPSPIPNAYISYTATQIAVFPSTDVANINSSTWTHLKTTYTPPIGSNNRFICLGNLDDDNTTAQNNLIPSGNITGGFGVFDIYYYVDNIRVTLNAPTVSLGNYTINCGDPVTLNATNPSNVFSYQWYLNGFALTGNGANTSSYTTTPTAMSTTYELVVTDVDGCSQSYFSTVTIVNQIQSSNIIIPEVKKSWAYAIDPLAVELSVINPVAGDEYFWSVTSGFAYPVAGNPTINTVTYKWTLPAANCSYLGQVKLKVVRNGCYYNEKIFDVYDLSYCDKVPIPSPLTSPSQIKDNVTITSASELSLSEYYFIGTIKIATNITMNDKHIWMAPEAKIVILPGYTLSVEGSATNNSYFTNSCSGTWDGIYLDNTGNISPKIIFRNSTLGYSRNGIVSINGAKFFIVNSLFNNNYISIAVKNYKRAAWSDPSLASLDGKIYGNKFNYSADMYTVYQASNNFYNLNCPMQNTPKYTGILVENVENFVIGDKNQAANEFSAMEHGIVLKSSSVDIVNCDFGNIRTINFAAAHPQGAVCITGSSMINDRIKIGYSNDLLAQNNFSMCDVGIFSEKNKFAIYKNNFNNISNFNIAISVRSYTNWGGSFISENYFNDCSYGIVVNNPVLNGGNQAKYLNITNNMFGSGSSWGSLTSNPGSNNMKHGIWVTNVNNKCIIKDNLIKLNGGYQSTRFGIRVENCDGINIENNTLMVNSTVGLTGNSQITGLLFNKTQKGTIIDNTFQNFGKGIDCNGNLANSIFKCNGFNYNQCGINFNQSSYTAISQQGSANNPTWITHNKWLVPQGGVRMSGKVMYNVNWYYNPQYGNNFDPTTNGLNINFPQLAINPSCSGYAYAIPQEVDPENMTAEEREILCNDIREGIEYNELMQEFQTYDNRWLFELLDNNPDVLFLDENSDQKYIDWYNAMKTANIGRFKDVLDLMEAGNYTDAATLNNSITPESDLFSYLKQVNAIYLATWCQGIYSFTEEQTLTLTTIAYLTPEEAGDAVYTARILLGIDPVLEGRVSFRLAPNKSISNNSKVRAYPNPVLDMLTIEFINQQSSNSGSIEILDLSGRIVMKTLYTGKKTKFNIDIKNLEKGIYLYRINCVEGQVFTGKINKI